MVGSAFQPAAPFEASILASRTRRDVFNQTLCYHHSSSQVFRPQNLPFVGK